MCPEQKRNQIKVKAHGVIAISFIITSVALGLIEIFKASTVYALLYLLIVALSFIVMATVYCSKCLIRDNCVHLFMGPLSKLFSKKKTGAYETFDYLVGAVFPFLLIYIIPQFWLINNMLYFILFWVLSIIGVLEVLIVVCKNCENTKCAMCKNH